MRAVMLPPVAPALKAKLPRPNCDLTPSTEYPPERLEAERTCLVRAETTARKRHAALASAVSVREAKAAELAAATR